jgi:hypothetical protein
MNATHTLTDREGRAYRVRLVWRETGRFMRPAVEGFRRYEMIKEFVK